MSEMRADRDAVENDVDRRDNVVSFHTSAARKIADAVGAMPAMAPLPPEHNTPETLAMAILIGLEREIGKPLTGQQIRERALFHSDIADVFEDMAQRRGAPRREEGVEVDVYATRDELRDEVTKLRYLALLERLYRRRALRGTLSWDEESTTATALAGWWKVLGPKARAEVEAYAERIKREALGIDD